MGYYTSWNTELELSTPLTSEQQITFLDFIKDMDSWWNIMNESDHQTLHVYEDDSFRSYEIYEELDKVLWFFDSLWIKINGEMKWEWEEAWDIWKIRIRDNEAWSSKFQDPSAIMDHLMSAWFEDAAKSIERHYFDKL